MHTLPDGKIELRSLLVEKNDIDITCEESVPVMRNFDSADIVGRAVVTRTPEGLQANIMLNRLFYFAELTPAICYRLINPQVGPSGEPVVKNRELLGLGLCDSLNVDERIRPLGEQITEMHL